VRSCFENVKNVAQSLELPKIWGVKKKTPFIGFFFKGACVSCVYERGGEYPAIINEIIVEKNENEINNHQKYQITWEYTPLTAPSVTFIGKYIPPAVPHGVKGDTTIINLNQIRKIISTPAHLLTGKI
jgi:hypothetical protein